VYIFIGHKKGSDGFIRAYIYVVTLKGHGYIYFEALRDLLKIKEIMVYDFPRLLKCLSEASFEAILGKSKADFY